MTRTFAAGDPAPEPLQAPPERSIVEGWTDRAADGPVVSILCLTFEQAAFIRDALNGVLAQRTPFPFELIVHDDGSTDGTAEIVAEFAQRYPKIVRAILRSTNSWAEAHPLARLIPQARGRYIALCEGDDYWIDPHKIATQVRDLERRPDAVVSHHDSVGVTDGSVVWPGRGPSHLRDHDPESLRRGDLTKMVSLCFRNVPLKFEEPAKNVRVMFDRLLGCMLAEHGGSVLSKDVIPAVYRVHQAGVWTGMPRDERAQVNAGERYWIAMHFARRGRQDLASYHLLRGMRSSLRQGARAGVDTSTSAMNLRMLASLFSTTELLRMAVGRARGRLAGLVPGLRGRARRASP